MKPLTHIINIYSIVIIMIIAESLCSAVFAIPLPMDNMHKQRTNFFTQRTGMAPTVSNVLLFIEQPEAFTSHPSSIINQRRSTIYLLPYLVTPEDSNCVVKILHACAARHKDDARTLFSCAQALIKTTFDVSGGIELHQTVVRMTNASAAVRLISAGLLVKQGIPAGYELMVETFASADESTNHSYLWRAVDVLTMYMLYVSEHLQKDAQGNMVPVITQEGEPIDLNAVAQIIMNNTALPFDIRLTVARICVGFDIPVGYDLMREAFASDNRQWHDQAEMLFLGYVNYVNRHSERGDTTPLYTLDGTPIDLEELAQHMTHEIVNPSVQRILNAY